MADHIIRLKKIEIGTYGEGGDEFWTNEDGAIEIVAGGDGILDVTSDLYWTGGANISFTEGIGWIKDTTNPNDANFFSILLNPTALLNSVTGLVDPDFTRITISVTGALTNGNAQAEYKYDLVSADDFERYTYHPLPSGTPTLPAKYKVDSNGDAGDIQEYVFEWDMTITDPPPDPLSFLLSIGYLS